LLPSSALKLPELQEQEPSAFCVELSGQGGGGVSPNPESIRAGLPVVRHSSNCGRGDFSQGGLAKRLFLFLVVIHQHLPMNIVHNEATGFHSTTTS
jgi:hypothetical protein